MIDKNMLIEALQIRHPRRRETTKRYRYQGGLMLRRASSRTGQEASIDEAIAYLVRVAPTLRATTVRQYRAGLLQIIRDRLRKGGLTLKSVARYLRQLGLLQAGPLEHGGNDLPVRCGAGRRRGLREADRRNTVLLLCQQPDPKLQTLAMLLTVGDMVGLRPHEWPRAEVQDEKLVVCSAKMNEWMKRGLVETREFSLAPLGKPWIERIAILCRTLNKDLHIHGTPDRVMARYMRHLRVYRTDDRMSLRSLRHQFRKNAQAAGWNAAEIAVAMNHASCDSQRVYGREGRGIRGMKLPQINASLVEHVRPARPHAEARMRMTADEVDVLPAPSPF